MSLSALILDMARLGTPAEAIAMAVKAIEDAQAEAMAPRIAARERKRKEREKKAAALAEAATVTRQSRDKPETVTDRPPKEYISNPPEPISAKADTPPLAERVVQAWNDGPGKAGATKSLKLTAKRSAGLRARVKEHGEDSVFRAIANVAASEWHCGNSGGSWKANIGWLLTSPEAFQNMLEREAAPSAKPKTYHPPEYYRESRELWARFYDSQEISHDQYRTEIAALKKLHGVEDDAEAAAPPERRNGGSPSIGALVSKFSPPPQQDSPQ